jgi:hypothetical protein
VLAVTVEVDAKGAAVVEIGGLVCSTVNRAEVNGGATAAGLLQPKRQSPENHATSLMQDCGVIAAA